MAMTKRRIYRVSFLNEGKVYEIYASRVAQSELFGFVEISGLLFGERGGVVVDPADERLRSEFEGVDPTHVPLQSIVRIDEVEKRGPSRISIISPTESASKVTTLPASGYPPKNSDT